MEANGSDLRLRLFGGLELTIGERPVRGLHRREADRVLAYLALHHSHIVPLGSVANTFWPGADASEDCARHSVQVIRRALGDYGATVTTVRGQGLVFDPDGVWIDTREFDRCIRQGGPEALRLAVEIYTGPLLADWDERWVEPHRVRLARQCAEALGVVAHAEAESGRFVEAARLLQRLVTMRPGDQSAWRTLMGVVLQASGAKGALRVYDRYEAYLAQRNLAPPDDMRRLRDKIHGSGARAGSSARPEVVEVPGGAVPLGSPFYVERPADSELIEAVRRRDSIVLIKGARQTGKSSLLARGLHAARTAGARVVVCDLEVFGAPELAGADSACRRLASLVADSAGAGVTPEDDWRPALSPCMNLTRYLVRHVLGDDTPHMVWCLDGVDRLFAHSWQQEFFATIRSWHEQRSFDPASAWSRLTTVMACATEAHLFIRDLSQSPFNVGCRIPLGDFSAADVADLNARHGSLLQPAGTDRLWRLTGGHPYLVRRALFEMSTGRYSLAQLEESALLDVGPFVEHLRRMAGFVCEDPGLRAAIDRVLEGDGCDAEAFTRLRSAGVLSGDSAQRPRFRCELYPTYLKAHRGC